MMTRRGAVPTHRRFLLGLPLALGACSVLPDRPYQATQDWPLLVPPPPARPAPTKAPILLLRPVRAAAGLESRGLHTMMPNGSLFTDPYQEWAAPPADAVNDQLQLWLAASGRFGAVITPGSRLTATTILEAELTALWTIQSDRQARATLAYILIDQRGAATRPILQANADGTAPVADDQPATRAAAQIAALAAAFTQLTGTLPTS